MLRGYFSGARKEQAAGLKPDWLALAVDALRSCEGLYITAGAGMSADSGLPTFRSKEGFWRAYPPAQKAGLSFSQVSNPSSFETDEVLAWGFFGHRYHLYTKAEPHQGYSILKRWAERDNKKYFVFTSNVDGMFERAGFAPETICECHGSIHYVQARYPNQTSCFDIVHASTTTLPTMTVNDQFRAEGELPTINGLEARPNIMMFSDHYFLDTRTEEQYDHKAKFFDRLTSAAKIVVVEIGAGKAVPTVRYESESVLGRYPNSKLLRINVDEWQGPPGTISIPETGLKALEMIDAAIA